MTGLQTKTMMKIMLWRRLCRNCLPAHWTGYGKGQFSVVTELVVILL
jgi:hypothetical protein